MRGKTLRNTRRKATRSIWHHVRELIPPLQSCAYPDPLTLKAELRCAKRASGAPWVRNFGKSIDTRNFGYDVSVGTPARTVGVEVGRQDRVWGQECSGNFPWREIAWQRCIRQPAFFWREILLVKSNGIRIKEQKKVREKRRQNLRNLKEESLQRIRGRTRRENFNEELRTELREIEREKNTY